MLNILPSFHIKMEIQSKIENFKSSSIFIDIFIHPYAIPFKAYFRKNQLALNLLTIKPAVVT